MKTYVKIIVAPALLALLATINSPLSTLHAQGTAFTYQGRLDAGVNPANGSYDLRFIVYDSSLGGSQQGPVLTNAGVSIVNGLFTSTLDFGNQFPGAGRWLEIAVRTNGNGAFTTLSPRQAVDSSAVCRLCRVSERLQFGGHNSGRKSFGFGCGLACRRQRLDWQSDCQ